MKFFTDLRRDDTAKCDKSDEQNISPLMYKIIEHSISSAHNGTRNDGKKTLFPLSFLPFYVCVCGWLVVIKKIETKPVAPGNCFQWQHKQKVEKDRATEQKMDQA